jgi:hypothetical protein
LCLLFYLIYPESGRAHVDQTPAKRHSRVFTGGSPASIP